MSHAAGTLHGGNCGLVSVRHRCLGHGPRHPLVRIGSSDGGCAVLMRRRVSLGNPVHGIVWYHHGHHHHDLFLGLVHPPLIQPHGLVMRHGPPELFVVLLQFAILPPRVPQFLVPSSTYGSKAGQLGDRARDEIYAVRRVERRGERGEGGSELELGLSDLSFLEASSALVPSLLGLSEEVPSSPPRPSPFSFPIAPPPMTEEAMAEIVPPPPPFPIAYPPFLAASSTANSYPTVAASRGCACARSGSSA
mmetsp:Transcript_19807/g.47572  ORF Transcript_19807/g.47572 Transcript_19807/m.47572 type:complete len:249 (+) Transcript_19807:1061-1807(+)